MMELRCFEELCVFDISVISGIRPRGRAVDHFKIGRPHSGFFYVFDGGASFVDADGVRTELGCGDLLFLPQGKCYRMEYTAESTTFVTVNFHTVTPMGEDVMLFSDLTVLQRGDDLKRTANIMLKLEQCSASQNASSVLRRAELVYRLLGMICRETTFVGGDRETNAQIVAGVRLLEQSYLENLPIERFAEECNVSVNTFRKLFGEQFGMPPVKYRNLLRIERAKTLLAEGGFTVAEVAYALGFSDPGYFSSFFKSKTGLSPAYYRKTANSR